MWVVDRCPGEVTNSCMYNKNSPWDLRFQKNLLLWQYMRECANIVIWCTKVWVFYASERWLQVVFWLFLFIGIVILGYYELHVARIEYMMIVHKESLIHNSLFDAVIWCVVFAMLQIATQRGSLRRFFSMYKNCILDWFF